MKKSFYLVLVLLLIASVSISCTAKPQSKQVPETSNTESADTSETPTKTPLESSTSSESSTGESDAEVAVTNLTIIFKYEDGKDIDFNFHDGENGDNTTHNNYRLNFIPSAEDVESMKETLIGIDYKNFTQDKIINRVSRALSVEEGYYQVEIVADYSDGTQIKIAE